MGKGPRLASAVACSILVGTATAAVSRPPPARFTFTAPHMGTEFRIILYADTEARASEAAHAAFARIASLDRVLSDYRDDSELTRLGRHAAGERVRVSDDLFRALSHAQRIARATGGAFDPTVGPLTKLWRRARRTSELPLPSEIESARDAVGYRKLTLDAATRTVRLDRENMRLDLGGIGKGFAADDAAVVLNHHGIQRALIAAGGDVAALGAPPQSDAWIVAIAPLDAPGGETRRIQLRNAAVSTSGDREQWLTRGAVRYSHIIDARTGRPVVGTNSVTVVSQKAADSDALATAIAVLGPEHGLKLVDAANGVAAFIQRARGERVETFASRRWISVIARQEAAVSSPRGGIPLLSPPPEARSFRNRPLPRTPR